jgi:hypothetical protein
VNGKPKELKVLRHKDLPTVWNEIHSRLAHIGRDKVLDIFRTRYWFVGWYTWISEQTNECINCAQKRFHLAPKTVAPLRVIPPTAKIMSRVHIDLTEGFYDVNGTHKVVAMAVCSFIIYVEGAVLEDKRAATIALFLWKDIFCRYLTPCECIIHDGDTTLAANVMKELFNRFRCTIKVTCGGNPKSNGQVEIFMKTVKERINALQVDYDYELPSDWDVTLFPQVLCGLRCSPAHATGKIPAELLLGRDLKFPFELNNDTTFEDLQTNMDPH